MSGGSLGDSVDEEEDKDVQSPGLSSQVREVKRHQCPKVRRVGKEQRPCSSAPRRPGVESGEEYLSDGV